nr:MAG TPA: hypothetical protein [Caudoviricetes sp.]
MTKLYHITANDIVPRLFYAGAKRNLIYLFYNAK